MTHRSGSVFTRVLVSVSLVALVVVCLGVSAQVRALAAQGDPLPVPEPTPAEANARADEILSHPEYTRQDQNPVLQKVGDWISEMIAKLLQSLVQGGYSSALSWIVIGVLVGVVILLVLRVGRTVQRAPRAEPELSIEMHRPASGWYAEAERREAEGDWKGALLCRYRALVSELVRREVLRDIPGRTTGEYRAELGSEAPVVAPEFSGASEIFERAWYGDLPTGASENTRFRELADDVLHGVPR